MNTQNDISSLNKKELGALGEKLAADHLRAAGLSIMERNYRVRQGEVDIIARDGEDLVFVEVKSRLSFHNGPAAENLTPVKFAQMNKMALYYIKARGYTEFPRLRFDAVTVEWRAEEEPHIVWLKGL
jgi:putative endonuclease